MENQSDFLFADGLGPEFHPPDPREGFYREVAAVWNLLFGVLQINFRLDQSLQKNLVQVFTLFRILNLITE